MGGGWGSRREEGTMARVGNIFDGGGSEEETHDVSITGLAFLGVLLGRGGNQHVRQCKEVVLPQLLIVHTVK